MAVIATPFQGLVATLPGNLNLHYNNPTISLLRKLLLRSILHGLSHPPEGLTNVRQLFFEQEILRNENETKTEYFRQQLQTLTDAAAALKGLPIFNGVCNTMMQQLRCSCARQCWMYPKTFPFMNSSQA